MRPALLGVLAIFLAALFLYSVTDGNLGDDGDDVFILAGLHGISPGQPYLDAAAGRSYLLFAYVKLYRALGSSTRNTHLFFLLLHAVNSALCFLVLRKLTGFRPALLGALFYLAYIGKYETLPQIAGGLYLAVMAVFFISAWIALASGNPWLRYGVITILNWLAVHLYEIAICVAPLPPLLIAIHRYRRRRPIFTLDFLPTPLPSLVLLIHFANMATRPGAPLWMRNPDMNLTGLAGLAAILRCAVMGLDTSMGLNHAGLLLACIGGFFRHVPLTVWYFVTLALCIAAIVVAWRRAQDSETPALSGHRTLVLIAAAYLIVVPPMMGFTVVREAMFTRLISIPAAGLALLIGSLVTWAPRTLRSALVAIVLAATLTEAVAMQSILCQAQVGGALDFSIRDQLRALSLPVRPRDGFHFSLPGDHLVRDFCIAVHSQFAYNGGDLLLVLDGTAARGSIG